jgi:hypothetical protein
MPGVVNEPGGKVVQKMEANMRGKKISSVM